MRPCLTWPRWKASWRCCARWWPNVTATGEHLAAQLQDTKAELKEAREDGLQLQSELLALARQDGKVKK
ncbi:hypothetical protein [Klebsiella pneumoniae]|uniref:hypothetical protein n=1 Tax=Klebsiella pneumoniae TaxID=573 RepID=UPI0029E7FC30|nr:hypothetical protein [Klebsiella pneumoniae]